MTVLGYERYPVDPASEASFKELVDEHLARIRSAGGALWADAAKAFDDEPSYVLLSEWRSAGDLDSWEANAEVRVFNERSDGYLRGEVTRRRYVSDPF